MKHLSDNEMQMIVLFFNYDYKAMLTQWLKIFSSFYIW